MFVKLEANSDILIQFWCYIQMPGSGKNSSMGLKQKSACLFGESGNPSITNYIFVKL